MLIQYNHATMAFFAIFFCYFVLFQTNISRFPWIFKVVTLSVGLRKFLEVFRVVYQALTSRRKRAKYGEHTELPFVDF